MTTETLRLYPGGPEVGYELGREAGEGDVMSIDLAGHHDLDVVDLVLDNGVGVRTVSAWLIHGIRRLPRRW